MEYAAHGMPQGNPMPGMAGYFPYGGMAPAEIHDDFATETVIGPVLKTPRLFLRRWLTRDFMPFIEMNSDAEVMQHFKGRMNAMDSLNEIEQQERCFEAYGYGMWAVERRDTGEFIGSVGIEPYMLPLNILPTATISWKLRRQFWGQNYAYEAARAVIDYAFEHLQVRELVALVPPENERSVRLMKRLGLSWEAQPLHA